MVVLCKRGTDGSFQTNVIRLVSLFAWCSGGIIMLLSELKIKEEVVENHVDIFLLPHLCYMGFVLLHLGSQHTSSLSERPTNHSLCSPC